MTEMAAVKTGRGRDAAELGRQLPVPPAAAAAATRHPVPAAHSSAADRRSNHAPSAQHPPPQFTRIRPANLHGAA